MYVCGDKILELWVNLQNIDGAKPSRLELSDLPDEGQDDRGVDDVIIVKSECKGYESPLCLFDKCSPEARCRLFRLGFINERQAAIEAIVSFEIYNRIFELHPNEDGKCGGALALAGCYMHLQCWTSALKFQEAVVKKSEIILGSQHPITIQRRIKLGEILGSLGRVDSAIELISGGIEDLEGLFGDSHPHPISAPRISLSSATGEGEAEGC